MNKTADCEFMRLALALARKGLGRVAENPAVGCVLVDATGCIIGRGRTANGGRPHAETIALAQAGDAKGATAYLTLEPCAHHGQTPPCAQSLIDAGVARVVVACDDPDPRVAGRGLEMLRAKGIAVETGLCEAEAVALNRGFFLRLTESRPFVTLKIAVSANGFMRVPEGAPRQISGAVAQNYVHLLRARHDAIMVGSGTLSADNPALDCRLSGLAAASPLPVVVDRRHTLPADAKALQNKRALIVADKAYVTAPHPHIDYAYLDAFTPRAMLQALAERQINRVLLEGGVRLAKSFVAAGLVDELLIIRAPHDLEMQGVSDIEHIGLQNLQLASGAKSVNLGGLELARIENRQLGADIMVRYIRER